MDGKVEKIMCPDPTCDIEIPEEELEMICGPTLFAKYQKFVVLKQLRSDPNTRWFVSEIVSVLAFFIPFALLLLLLLLSRCCCCCRFCCFCCIVIMSNGLFFLLSLSHALSSLSLSLSIYIY